MSIRAPSPRTTAPPLAAIPHSQASPARHHGSVRRAPPRPNPPSPFHRVRRSVAWCKRVELPIEKVFARTLQDKFPWAMGESMKFQF